MIKEAISSVIDGLDLDEQASEQVMSTIMDGEATPAQIACFITALRLKGEHVSEITGCARAMRSRVKKVKPPEVKPPGTGVVDTCGTGGDGSNTFNISTVAALVAAGMGLVVAKHGNRSVSSRCGSADLLRELGVNIEAGVECVERCLAEAGIGFLYAPLLHPAMKYAIGPRREIGIRTVFNILGPLTNPAGAKMQLLGVYDGALTSVLAEVLGRLGSTRAMVVHGEDGLDEITLTGPTVVAELEAGAVRTYSVSPADLGLESVDAGDLKGGDEKENARIARSVLAGEPGPARDTVLANAAAVAVVGGKAADLRQGVAAARQSIDSGAAREKLERLVELTTSAA